MVDTMEFYILQSQTAYLPNHERGHDHDKTLLLSYGSFYNAASDGLQPQNRQ